MPETPEKLAKDGTQRGGVRLGPDGKPLQGRKKKIVGGGATSLSDLELKALLSEEPPEEIDQVAAQHAPLAIETLARVLIHGASESAKITAAKEILDRGYGRPAVEIGGDAAMLPFMMAPSVVPSVAAEIRAKARKYAPVAIATLRKIAQDGQSETARAQASKALLDRGLGTVGKARMPEEQRDAPLGKKEQAQRAAAAAATGRYATPAPPPRAAQGAQ